MLIDLLTDRSNDDADALFAAQTRFRSPFADYHGREDVVHLVGHIRRVLGDARTVRRFGDADTTVSVFEARVGEHEVQGVLVEERDAAGRLADAMLIVRPYAGLRAAMGAMQALLDESPLPSA
ncbi:MAG TPA: hypothetical protein VKB54_19900 [Solirubrobacteraceae bacterium]|nr:hypothetical protein [Solirubrobacteraceae bacterium]